jgi:hypothetical protein
MIKNFKNFKIITENIWSGYTEEKANKIINILKDNGGEMENKKLAEEFGVFSHIEYLSDAMLDFYTVLGELDKDGIIGESPDKTKVILK